MRAIHAAVFDLRQVAVVATVDAEVGVVVSEQFLEVPPVESTKTVLRVVVTPTESVLDKIDHIGVGYLGILLYEPREGIYRIVVDVPDRPPYLFPFAAKDTSDGSAQMAVLGDGVDVVGEVYMSEPFFRQRQVELLEYETCVLVEPGDEEAALVGEHRVLGGESSVLVALGVKQLFCTGGEEECRIDDVRADDGLVLRRLLYHRTG